MKCNVCNKNKSESQFYLKGHWIKGKYYTNFDMTCKECRCEINRKKRMGLIPVKKKEKKEEKKNMNWMNENNNLTIRDVPVYCNEKVQETDNREAWAIRNLKRHGNCFVNKKHDFRKIEKECGKLRFVALANGYIIEVVK